KPAFGGNIVAPILSRTTPALVTIRPGMMQPPEPDPARQTILMRLPVYPMPVRTRILSQDTITEEGVALDNAEIVIGVGTGVGADWRAFAETFGQVVAQAAEPAH